MKKETTKDIMALEVKEVVFDKQNNEVYIYLENKDHLEEYIERYRQRDMNGDYFICVKYELNNPNKAIDLGMKLRKILVNHGYTGSEIFKELKTWERWIQELKGTKVHLNEYGQLA